MATFGETTAAVDVNYQARADELCGTVYTLSEWGWISKVTAYGRSNTGTAQVKGAIWKYDNRGAPQQLMAVSPAASWTTSTAWRDHTFSSKVLLPPGKYLLAVVCGSATNYPRFYHRNVAGAKNVRLARYTPCSYASPPDLNIVMSSYMIADDSYGSCIYATYTAITGVPEKTNNKFYCLAGQYPKSNLFEDDSNFGDTNRDSTIDEKWEPLWENTTTAAAYPIMASVQSDGLNMLLYGYEWMHGAEATFGYRWDTAPEGDFSVEYRCESIVPWNIDPNTGTQWIDFRLDDVSSGVSDSTPYSVQYRFNGSDWYWLTYSGTTPTAVQGIISSGTTFVPCSFKMEWLNSVFKTYYRLASSGTWTQCGNCSMTAPIKGYRPNACSFSLYNVVGDIAQCSYIYAVSNFVVTPLSAVGADIFTTTTGLGNYLPVTYSGTTTGYIQLYPTANDYVTTSVKVIGSDDNEYYISTVWSGTLTPPA